MRILRRPGFADYVLNEGRIHTDILKKRIADCLDRNTLGKSPVYVVQKIAEELKLKYGENFDLSTLKADEIVQIANSPYITRGLFEPKLRQEFQPQDQTSEVETQEVEDEFEGEVEAQDEEDLVGDYFTAQSQETEEDPFDSEDYSDTYSDSEFETQELATAAESAQVKRKETARMLNEQYKRRLQKLFLTEERYNGR
jgi:hypothetical protein